MAAGKSTAGRALASLLRWRFVDLDFEIESQAKKSIAEIFAECGEAEFRRREAEALLSVLEGREAPTVIALGGGTFVQPDNAEGLRQRGVRVVFLELPLEQLLKRCHAAGERDGGNPRPLAVDEGAFRALYEGRLPFYRRADLTVDVQDKAPEEIAHEIAKRLRVSDYAGSP
jgi:shikimate kinase